MKNRFSLTEDHKIQFANHGKATYHVRKRHIRFTLNCPLNSFSLMFTVMSVSIYEIKLTSEKKNQMLVFDCQNLSVGLLLLSGIYDSSSNELFGTTACKGLNFTRQLVRGLEKACKGLDNSFLPGLACKGGEALRIRPLAG